MIRIRMPLLDVTGAMRNPAPARYPMAFAICLTTFLACNVAWSIMPSRSSKDHDFTRSTLRTVEQVIGEKWDGSPLEKPTKNPAAVALGEARGSRRRRSAGGGAQPSKTIRDCEGGREGSLIEGLFSTNSRPNVPLVNLWFLVTPPGFQSPIQLTQREDNSVQIPAMRAFEQSPPSSVCLPDAD